MSNNVVLTNFRPILIGPLLNQDQLNQYTKFLYYHHHQNQFENSKQLQSDGGISNVLVPDDNYELVSAHVDKYSISGKNIDKRQVLLFENVEDFIAETMSVHFPIEGYKLPSIYLENPGHQFGPKIGEKMKWFNEKMCTVFDNFYENQADRPEHLIHVTCSGYASPSVAQQAISARNWNETIVTHSYQMGCYGAFPAIRTARSLMAAGNDNGRIDIVHTELLSAHLNLSELSNANTMITSLFADGFIGYSLYEEGKFKEQSTTNGGLKILASNEIIIPDSLEDMSWNLGECSFLMTLSKRVPVLIRQYISGFIKKLCEKANINFEEEKSNMYFAIHPGGPKIIDYVIEELGIAKEQAFWSYEIFKRQGNMSSSTVPHIFNEIVNDDKIRKGTIVIAVAFGPGLTATSLLLEKV